MIIGLNHITLSVDDLSESVDFYKGVLGFNLTCKWKKGAYLTMGELWLCLTEQNEMTSLISNDRYTHYAFSISSQDYPLFLDKLNKNSVKTWQDNSSEGNSHYFLDPSGHKLEIHVGNLQSRLLSYEQNPPEGYELHDDDYKEKSVVISQFQDIWKHEYLVIKDKILKYFNDKKCSTEILGIEHIGSTAVTNLMAKDKIDIQLGISSLEDNVFEQIKEGLEVLGFQHIPQIERDHVPSFHSQQNIKFWNKRFFCSRSPLRPINLHVRVYQNENWNYAIEFRDFLESNPHVKDLYEQSKIRLAEGLKGDRMLYSYVKDPICDLIYTMKHMSDR